MSKRRRGAQRPPAAPTTPPPPVKIEPEAILAESGLIRKLLADCGVPRRDRDDVLQECLVGAVVGVRDVPSRALRVRSSHADVVKSGWSAQGSAPLEGERQALSHVAPG